MNPIFSNVSLWHETNEIEHDEIVSTKDSATQAISNQWSSQWGELCERYKDKKLSPAEVISENVELFPIVHSSHIPQYLQEMNRRCLASPNVMTPECFEHFLRVAAHPDMKVVVPETHFPTTRRAEHMQDTRKYLEVNPNYDLKVISSMISYNKRIGRVTVLTHARATGLSKAKDKVRESGNDAVFSRDMEGHWLCYELSTLRGLRVISL